MTQVVSFKRIALLAVAVVAVCTFAIGTAVAYENYNDPAVAEGTEDPEGVPNEGYCSSCHNGFLNKGPLHDAHLAKYDLPLGCDTCHYSSQRDNPYVMISDSPSYVGQGCMGCHGRDYGENVAGAYPPLFNTTGAAKGSGYGLRKQHKNQGVTVCEDCHADVDQSLIFAENTPLPQYYPDALATGVDPCNADGSEDFIGPTTGLDNDGDGFIDGLDSDCGAATATPGEASDPGVQQMLVTGHASGTNLTMTWDTATCDSTDFNIEYGLLSNVANYTYSGQQCGIGTSSPYAWGYPGDSLFFMVVGTKASNDGSYGVDSSSAERPEDLVDPTCAFSQSLADRCDP